MSDNKNSKDVEVDEMHKEFAKEKTVTLEIPLDDVHENIYEQLNGGDVNVDVLLAGNLRQPMEQTLHQLYQNIKYNE